jgi:heptosyltransferase-2
VWSINRNSKAFVRNRLIVTAPNWLGDAVMSLPLVGLLSALENVHVTVLAPPYTARIYGGVSGLDELVIYPRRSRSRGLLWQWRLLTRLRPAAAILLPPSFSSALPAFLAGVPVRIGYRSDGRGWLLTESRPAGNLRTSRVSDNYLELGRMAAGRLGLSVPETFPIPRIRIYQEESKRLDRLLDAVGAPRRRFCLIAPGAAYGPAKTWLESAWREAIRVLAAELPVVLTGSPSDRAPAARLAENVDQVYNLAGLTDLGEFLSLIERAGVLIANDSGAPHAAGSLGTPAVVIFGSTSPVWTRPLGEPVEIIRRPILCSPCFLRECPTQLECFRHIEPAVVVSRALDLFKKGVDISTGRG